MSTTLPLSKCGHHPQARPYSQLPGGGPPECRGTEDDIAAAGAFLASPLAGDINGIDLRVDGGVTGVP